MTDNYPPTDCPNCATLRTEVRAIIAHEINELTKRITSASGDDRYRNGSIVLTGLKAMVGRVLAILDATPTPPTDAATCPECGGAKAVSNDLGLNWKLCPACQRQQDSNEWTPSGSLLPERFVSVTEPPQQQAPPQQEQGLSPLAQTFGVISEYVDGADAKSGIQALDAWRALGKESIRDRGKALAELLHRQEQRIRADERARVIKLLDEMDAEVFETQRVSRDQAYLSASPYVGERNVIQRVHQRLEMGDE